MKKEVFIAIIIGFTFGLVITFGVYSAQQSLKEKNAPPVSQINATPTPTTIEDTHNLTISSPENGALISSAIATITGTTNPLSLLSLTSNKDYTTATADSQGNFSAKISLDEGANLITLKAFNQGGNMSTQTLTLIYIPDKSLEPSPTSKPTPSKKPSL